MKIISGERHLIFGNDALCASLEMDEMLAHHIQAVFEGDEPCSASAYAFTHNGTEYAVCATLQYGYKPSSNMMTLTVDSSTHIFFVKLIDESIDMPIPNAVVKIYLNDTLMGTYSTGPEAYFDVDRNFDPGNTSVSYTVKAVYEGCNVSTATLNATDLEGNSYTICSTFYSYYKPSANVTTFVVEPQATSTQTPAKTPEQLQQEAQDSGWLSVYSEFSWWYPWYRLHVKIHINPTIDIGFNPILPGGETHNWDGLEKFEAVTAEALEDVGIDLAGMFAAYVTAKTTSIINPAVGVLIESVKLGVALVFLYNDWDNMVAVGATALVSIVMGLVVISTDVAGDFLLAVCGLIVGSAASALQWICDQLLHVVCVSMLITRWWIDALEVIFDWIVGGLALAHYCGVL
jgi:hypothetical protein